MRALAGAEASAQKHRIAKSSPFDMSFWPPQPRQPFIGLALAAVLGIFIADRWEVSPVCALGFAALGVLVVMLRPGVMSCCLLCSLTFFELHTLRRYGSDARHLAKILAGGPRVARVTGIVWNEPEKPATASRTTTARFLLKTEVLEISGERIFAPFLFNVSWSGAMPAYGDRIALTGSAANLEEKRNPGQFDYAGYQRRHGVYSEIRTRYASDCRIDSHHHGRPAQAFAYRTSRWIQRQLRIDLEDSPEISGLIASMVLGLRGETPEDMKALFQRTGTMHLFAVSGLNVAMLAAIILAGLRVLGVRRGPAVLIVTPILAGYALVTGLTPSCIRATIMLTMVLLGYVFDRRPLVLNSLGAAAFLILLWDTEQFFSAGFQFSFVLVITIVWLAVKIQRRLEVFGHPDAFLPRELWSSVQRARVWLAGRVAMALGVTLAAWLGSLIFTVGYFHLFSPAAIFANLFAVPLAFGVLLLGLASVLFAPLWVTGVVLCNNANWFCAKILLKGLELFALVPGSYVYVETPRLTPAPATELTVFDLGEGGAAHVRAEGCDWLLDCGSTGDYDRTLLPYLRSRGVNRLDGLLLTHGDAGHLGGALPAIIDFEPRLLAVSVLRDISSTRRKLHTDLNRRAFPKGLYERGDLIRVGDRATLRVLYPPAGLRRSVADDKALVVQLETAGQRVLFMADSGFTTEQWLLENEPGLRSEILIKGHHAKDLSGTPDFLARVGPQAVICGALAYGEPREKLDPWTHAASARGIAVFRQDRTGAVQVEIRDGGFELRGYLNGQTFRSRAR
jgi:competence protein ComEC